MITIYNPKETDFTGNGIAVLTPSTCIVNEAINGDYQLQMAHPVDDAGVWKHIEEDCVLRVPSHRGLDTFRIYRIDKSITMLQRIYARHLTYDMLTDLVVHRAPTNVSAMNALQTALEHTGFTGLSNVDGRESARWVRKNSVACIMGNEDNSIVNRWGGEVLRQNRRIDVLARIGQDNGVSIRYRKNLTGLDVTVDLSGVATRVMPTGLKEDGQTVLELPETFVESPLIGAYAKVRTQHIHYGDIKVAGPEDEGLTEGEALQALRDRVKEAFQAGLDKPAVSAKVSFVDLSQTIEYAEYKHLEKVGLGDVVHVWHSELNVDMAARVVSVVWDCLREKYDQITIGQEGVNIAAVLNNQNRKIAKDASERADGLQQAIDEATGLLLSPGDSFVRFYPNLSNPSEILIMDAPNPEDAVNVMRLNRNGWGLSTTGVNGPFVTAATAHGMVADVITTGVINAALIKIMGSAGTFWDDNYIQITDQFNPNNIMRFGLYDGVRSGLAFSQDGGITWGTAIAFDGSYIGSGVAGFDISSAGLTNGNLIQLWADGRIRLGGIRMDGGADPFFSFEYGGAEAFRISGGSVYVNQALNVTGPTYLSEPVRITSIGTTSSPPNLFIDGSGRLYRSTYDIEANIKSISGGGTGGGTTTTPPPTYSQTATTTASNVPLRSGSSDAAPLITTIPASGTQVYISGIPIMASGIMWYPVVWGSYNGYIKASNLRLS